MGRCKQKILMPDGVLPSKGFESGSVILPEITDIADSISHGSSAHVDMKQFLCYEDVKKRIVYKLVNTDRNRELLADIPHREFLDLSVVFQCMLAGSRQSGTAALLIHNAHAKLWGVSADDLYRAATENTLRLMGCELKTMDDVICEILQEESPESFDRDTAKAGLADSVPLYVLSNRYRVDGAACVLYPELLQEICGRLKSSFYIIPSSVHELLIMPVDNSDTGAEILGIIKEVNDTQVKSEEILSYSLYYYDGNEDRISIV